jgi:hypothetical protein
VFPLGLAILREVRHASAKQGVRSGSLDAVLATA